MKSKQKHELLPSSVDSVTVLTTVRTFSFSGAGKIIESTGGREDLEGPSAQSKQNIRKFTKQKKLSRRTKNFNYSLLSNIQ